MKEKLLKYLKKIQNWFEADYFWGEKSIEILVAVNFLINLVIWIVVIVKSGSTEIPLSNVIAKSAHYLTAHGKEIYILPIIGLLISIINVFFARETFRRERFLSYILLGTSLFVQLLIFTTIVIYLLV